MVNSSVEGEMEVEMSFFVTKQFVKRKYDTDKGWIIDFDHVNTRLFQSIEEARKYTKHQCSSGKIDETFYIIDVRNNQTVEMIIKADFGKISSSRV